MNCSEVTNKINALFAANALNKLFRDRGNIKEVVVTKEQIIKSNTKGINGMFVGTNIPYLAIDATLEEVIQTPVVRLWFAPSDDIYGQLVAVWRPHATNGHLAQIGGTEAFDKFIKYYRGMVKTEKRTGLAVI